MKKVLCLYRVSTLGQVDPRDDIPMQRRECEEFIARQPDWMYYGERLEKGVSGYKVSASKRDAILEIRAMAERKQFEILPAKWIQSHYSEHPPKPLEIRHFVTVA